MHLSVYVALALPIFGAALAAQERVVRPGGASSAALHARQCENPKIEMVDVRPVASSDGGAVSHDYLDRAAKELFFYFNPPEAKRPRYTILRLVAHSDGSLTGLQVMESSQNDYFDREVTRSIREAARGGAFVPFPQAVHADSLMLELSFGRHAGNADPYFAKRAVCPAWPRQMNPTPEYPRELREQGVRGFVRARFMVDADGKARPSTFMVLQATDKRFVRAVEDILPQLKYMPAEVQGRKVEQLTEQIFSFGLEYRPQP
jgi:outer membrane biosynthesis protein TonB